MTDDPENPEVFIREDEAWIPDGKALCEKVGALYIYFSEGDLYAGIAGRGDVALADLIAEIGKRGIVTAITPKGTQHEC
jgi:hypothetical protein